MNGATSTAWSDTGRPGHAKPCSGRQHDVHETLGARASTTWQVPGTAAPRPTSSFRGLFLASSSGSDGKVSAAIRIDQQKQDAV